MPKSRSGLLLSHRDVTMLDSKRLVKRVNDMWTNILVEASKLRAVPEEERDFLFWSRCSCWRSSVWKFQDILHFLKECRVIDCGKYVAIQEQISNLLHDVERGSVDAKI